MNAYIAGKKLAQELGHATNKPGTLAAMNETGSVVSKLADFVAASDGTQAGRRRAAISLAFTLSDRRDALSQLLTTYDELGQERVDLAKDWEDVNWSYSNDVQKLERKGDNLDATEAGLLHEFVKLLREV